MRQTRWRAQRCTDLASCCLPGTRVDQRRKPLRMTASAAGDAAPTVMKRKSWSRRSCASAALVVMPMAMPAARALARARSALRKSFSIPRERLVVRAPHVGVRLLGRNVALRNEFLQAPAVDGFARIEIAFRVERDHVQQGEVAGAVPLAAEAADDARLLAARHIAV